MFEPRLPSVVYLNSVCSLGSLGPIPFCDVETRYFQEFDSIAVRVSGLLSCLPPRSLLGLASCLQEGGPGLRQESGKIFLYFTNTLFPYRKSMGKRVTLNKLFHPSKLQFPLHGKGIIVTNLQFLFL